jgi:hypothetical protein
VVLFLLFTPGHLGCISLLFNEQGDVLLAKAKGARS